MLRSDLRDFLGTCGDVTYSSLFFGDSTLIEIFEHESKEVKVHGLICNELKIADERSEFDSVASEATLTHGSTLLDKALFYRHHFPQKWERREEEAKKFTEESQGQSKDDLFLETYYNRLEEIKQEEMELETLRRQQPPRIIFSLEMNIPDDNFRGSNFSLQENQRYLGYDVTVFNKSSTFLDFFKIHKTDEKQNEAEIIIAVIKGKNLLNGFEVGNSKCWDCRVKCKLFPDALNHVTKLKTNYVYATRKGTARWKHLFVIKGFTLEQLSSKHVILYVTAKGHQGKRYIGKVVLAGENASIQVKGNLYRRPTENEIKFWQEALGNPGRSVNIKHDINHPYNDELNYEAVDSAVRFATTTTIASSNHLVLQVV